LTQNFVSLYFKKLNLMENTLAQKAISFALQCKWESALEINLQILSSNPDDVDALNRSARCYAELGDVNKALAATQKVVILDPLNNIAQKNLSKWKNNPPIKHTGKDPIISDTFLEESGKTKIIPLLNLGDSHLFANLNCGDEVKLITSAHKVSVTETDGKYIGRLPDDVAARLKGLMKNGAKYLTLIKAIDQHNISVFIREIENKTGITSFPPEKLDYVSFTPPELVHKNLGMTGNSEDIVD
jgi:tetratricopeptide (TPR) repeat protein